VQPLSTRTQIYIIPDNLYPHVGDSGHIYIRVDYWEWPWSDGYMIIIRYCAAYAQLINYYDSPSIYFQGGYQYVNWVFLPPGGVYGSGSETRPYIDVIYIRSGDIVVYAEVYQVWVYYVGNARILIPQFRASTYITIHISS